MTFTLDPLVKTNHPADKTFPHFVKAHEQQLPQYLIELDFGWIQPTLDELVVVTTDPLYWTARCGRFQPVEPDPTRAYFVPTFGELQLNRILPEGNMWHLLLWSEPTDLRLPGQFVATSVLAPWSSNEDIQVDMIRQSTLSVLARLDAMDESLRAGGWPAMTGRIRAREA